MSSELLSVIREEYGRITYSFKTHQKMIDHYNRRLIWQKRANAFLLTATAAGTIDNFVRDELISKVLTAACVSVALCLAIYQLSMSTDRLIDQHRTAARALWLLREEYIHLIGDLKAGSIDTPAARDKRDTLMIRAARIYEGAPDTNSSAYNEAKKALQQDEELTFSVREIDLLLPDALREASQSQAISTP